MTIESIVAALRITTSTIPQPEGAEVADAYEAGILDDPNTMLRVIAFLLHKARQA